MHIDGIIMIHSQSEIEKKNKLNIGTIYIIVYFKVTVHNYVLIQIQLNILLSISEGKWNFSKYVFACKLSCIVISVHL